MKRYIKLWWIYTLRTTQIALSSRIGMVIFTVGKLLRFLLYILFLFVLVSQTKTLAGYSLWEIIFFFATFNLIDTAAQFFLREVYRFRGHVVSGFFDTYLVKPISPLFKALFGGSDVLDILLLIVSVVLIGISSKEFTISISQIGLYILLLMNAFVIALSFHIFVIALGILTTEVDNVLWMYRDLTQMGRVPVDIYHQPIRDIITFIIPVGIMMTFPAKAMLGLLTVNGVILSLVVGVFFLTASIYFWIFALKHYCSASS